MHYVLDIVEPKEWGPEIFCVSNVFGYHGMPGWASEAAHAEGCGDCCCGCCCCGSCWCNCAEPAGLSLTWEQPTVQWGPLWQACWFFLSKRNDLWNSHLWKSWNGLWVTRLDSWPELAAGLAFAAEGAAAEGPSDSQGGPREKNHRPAENNSTTIFLNDSKTAKRGSQANPALWGLCPSVLSSQDSLSQNGASWHLLAASLAVSGSPRCEGTLGKGPSLRESWKATKEIPKSEGY